MRKRLRAMKYILAFILFAVAAQSAGEVQSSARTVTASLTQAAQGASRAEEICRSEADREGSQYVCFWGEQKNLSLSCRETGASAQVTLVLAVGASELAVPGTAQLKWQEKGCCLDRETAARLFGTENAAGQVVWCGGEAYTVCGTFQSLREMMVRIAVEADGEALTGVSMYLPQEGNRKREAEEFLMRNGLEGELTDLFFLEALASDLLLLLPLILAMRLAAFLIRCASSAEQDALACAGYLDCGTPGGKSRRGQGKFSGFQVGRPGWYLAAAAAVGLAAGFVYRNFQIPSDMIPTKWSDFSFWPDWWEGQRQNLLRILETAQGEAQLETLWELALSALCSLLAAALL